MSKAILIHRGDKDFWQFEDGFEVPAISGGYTWVAAAVVVVAVAVSTYATYQAQESQKAMYEAQADANDQRARLEADAARLEAQRIQERANWEAQASRDAADFEARTAQERAEFEAQSAQEIAQLEAAGAQELAAFEARTAMEIAELEAEAMRQKGGFEERESRRRSSIILAKKRALAAAGGVSLTSGSPLMAELDHIRQAEIEALGIRTTAETAALVTERKGQIQSEGAITRGNLTETELMRKAALKSTSVFRSASEIAASSDYEARLRIGSIQQNAADSSWSKLFEGKVKSSEAKFAADMARFGARSTSQAQSWTILKGVTQAAAAGMSAYSMAGGGVGTGTDPTGSGYNGFYGFQGKNWSMGR
jgi:hypothetical protein